MTFDVARATENGQVKGATVDVTACIAAVQSDCFRSYVAMIDITAAVGKYLQAWLMGCPCHNGDSAKALQTRVRLLSAGRAEIA